MNIEVLNKDLVSAKIKENGWTRNYVAAQLGLKKGEGYVFLRGEWLPKDEARKARLVGKLANMLGVEVPQILLRLEARSA